MPRPGRKFRFRAGLAAWQSRNAGLISGSGLAWTVQITVLSRVSGVRPVSEFLIVGCHHGWLDRIGYDRGGFELAAIRVAGGAERALWYGFCSLHPSVPVRGGVGRSNGGTEIRISKAGTPAPKHTLY